MKLAPEYGVDDIASRCQVHWKGADEKTLEMLGGILSPTEAHRKQSQALNEHSTAPAGSRAWHPCAGHGG